MHIRQHETRDGVDWAHEPSPLDALAIYPSERTPGASAPSCAPPTVSQMPAADQDRRSVRSEGRVAAPTKPVVPPTPPATSLWELLRTLPPSARWVACFAVLVPSLATLVLLRTPISSTARAGDPAQAVAVVGTARPVDEPRDAPLGTQPPDISAPRDPTTVLVSAISSQPTPVPEPRLSALTSPPPPAGARVTPSVSPSARPNNAAAQPAPLVRPADPVSVNVIVPDDKATARVTPGPARNTSSDRTTYRGTISVESQPAGGQVSVDGQSVGVTPLVGWELPAGSHVVRIDLDGYERWSTSIQVVTEKTVNVVTTLRPARQN